MASSIRPKFKRPKAYELIPLADEAAAEASAPAAGVAVPSRVETALLALLLGGSVALVIVTAIDSYLASPFSDGYDWVAAVFATERSHAWAADVWSPHAEQRIPIARIVQALDVELIGGRAPTFLIVAALFIGGGLASLFATIGGAMTSLRLKAWLISLTGCILVNVALAEDLAFPGFSVYVFVVGPALATCAVFAPSRREGFTAPFALALAAAALASGGNAAGLAIWPALIAASLVQRRSSAQLAALVAVALVCIVACEAGLGLPSRSFGATATHLLKMASYFGQFGGLPWSRAIRSAPVGALFGLAVEGAAVVALASTIRRAPWDDRFAILRATGAMLIAFGLATAMLATVGRVDELPQPIAPTRYVPFASLLQIGLLLTLAEPLDAALRRRPRAVTAGLGVLGAVWFAFQIPHATSLIRFAQRIRVAGQALDAGADAPLPGVVLYPDPARARAIRRQLKARALPY